MRVKTADFELAGEGGRPGGVVAYAATFDRESDSYGDVVAKGAFADTLRAWDAVI